MEYEPPGQRSRTTRKNGRWIKIISFVLMLAVFVQIYDFMAFLGVSKTTMDTTEDDILISYEDVDVDVDVKTNEEEEEEDKQKHAVKEMPVLDAKENDKRKELESAPQSDVQSDVQSVVNHKKYDKVVIATKIHGHSHEVRRLEKMFCFCTAAYNQYVNYNVVIFVTLPLNQIYVDKLQKAVAPAHLTIARDGPDLEGHIAAMNEKELEFLYERCDVKPGTNITWDHLCKEEGASTVSLGYSWMVEFRAYHIWKQDVLANYKYMIWFDSDANCIEPWKEDPMKVMIENDLAILMYYFNYGTTRNPIVRPKMREVYNREICKVQYNGKHLEGVDCNGPDDPTALSQIHGFHHITNLDFYRNETQQRFLKLMVGDYRFSRTWDDQIGVTLPAVLGAPTRAWLYNDHGLNMTLTHKEKKIDSPRGAVAKSDFRRYWFDDGGEDKMPGGKKCTKHLE